MSNGDCCKGLKEQLAALTREVNNVKQEFQKANQKIGELDRRLKNLEGKNGENKQGGQNKNEAQILSRIAKLENYCGSVEQILTTITPVIKAIGGLFS